MDLSERLGLRVPVVQAGMGGGISRAELAVAVSAAGALGTIGILPAPRLRHEIQRAREQLGSRPFAVNLLMPYLRADHVDVCVAERVPVVTLFCGHDDEVVRRLHEAGSFVMHQVGDEASARRAIADGADALIVQGREAGGHVLAGRPLRETLAAVLRVAGSTPVLAAGGITDAADVRRALAAGAAAVVAGTRFLLTDECHAHPAYQRRVLGARDTVLTTLFSAGWSDPHRVVPNSAVRRWCAEDGEPRLAPRLVTAVTMPIARRIPMTASGRFVARQRVATPLFSPAAMVRGDDDSLLEVTPLYAGVGAARIGSVITAAEAVRRLTPG